jgi:hypothetical protein
MEYPKGNNDEFGSQPAKRLLGQVLVDGGFITQADLDLALAEQIRTKERLGEVLIRMGKLGPEEIDVVVSIQGDLASLSGAVKAAAGGRHNLGDLLLKAKRVTPEQLGNALVEQQRTGEKLGRVFVRQGLLTDGELDAILEFQHHQGGEAPASAQLRLGEILVATGQITRGQLDAVLTQREATQKKLGELLVETGAAQPHQVARGLKLQEKLVTAAILAVLSLASVGSSQETPSGGSRSSAARVEVRVTATVASRAVMKVINQCPAVVITDADIARGYVDVPSASRIEVRNNSRAGYLLVFTGIGGPFPMFDQVHVKGTGTEIQIGPDGGWVPQPYVRDTVTMELSYRFILSKSIQPGTYDWPLSLSARPM